MEVMPIVPGQTDDQRRSAISNALSRLRIKKVITQVEHGEWTLA